MEFVLLSFIAIIITNFTIYYSIKSYKYSDNILTSYTILNKEIEKLTSYYIETKILPLKLIPDNKFTKEELKSYRDECIKFVLETINNSPISNIKSIIYSDEYISYLVDRYFVKKTIV